MAYGSNSYANSLDVQPGSTAASASSKQTSSQKHASSGASSGAKENPKLTNGIKKAAAKTLNPAETGTQSTLLSATGGPFQSATAQQTAAAGTMTFPEQEDQDRYPRTEERTQVRMRECERMVAGVRNAGLLQ